MATPKSNPDLILNNQRKIFSLSQFFKIEAYDDMLDMLLKKNRIMQY